MRTSFAVAVALALLYVLGLWVWSAEFPLFSDSLTHLALAGGMKGIFASFDPELMPLRPAQHAWFQILYTIGDFPPGLARLPLLVLHALSAVLLHRLVRQLGGSPSAALLGSAAFLTAPAIKSLAWVAAIGWPGKTAAILTALNLLLRHRRSPNLWTGVGILLSALVAVSFHQSAFLLLAFFLLLPTGDDSPRPRELLRSIRLMLRDRWILITCLTLGAYVVYVGFLREARYHNLVLNALPANTVRAVLCVFPEIVRVPVVAGLRGMHGTTGLVLGVLVFGGVLAAWLWGIWRTRAVGRFVLIGIAVELSLPVLTTGFTQRYSYTAAALLAVGIGIGWDRMRAAGHGRLWLALTGLLMALWTWDQVQDVRDYDEVVEIRHQVIEQLLTIEQSLGRDEPLWIVDVPWHGGTEKDLPLLNQGLSMVLHRAGSRADWILVTPERHSFTVDFQSVPPAELEELVVQHPGRVWRYEPQTRRYHELRD